MKNDILNRRKFPKESALYPKMSDGVCGAIRNIIQEAINSGNNKIFIRTNLKRGLPLENINRVLSDFNQAKKNNPIDVIKEYEADYIIINNDFLTGTKDKIKNTGKTKHLIDIYNYSIYKIL